MKRKKAQEKMDQQLQQDFLVGIELHVCVPH